MAVMIDGCLNSSRTLQHKACSRHHDGDRPIGAAFGKNVGAPHIFAALDLSYRGTV